jgi:MFS family permease
MVFLGVGWNFLYTSGSTLLTTRYRPAEKNRVQGFTDFCVFSVMVTSSAASGAMLITNGWNWLNLLSLPFPVLVLFAIWRVSRIPPRADA